MVMAPPPCIMWRERVLPGACDDAAYQNSRILIKLVSEICIFMEAQKQTRTAFVSDPLPPLLEFTEAKHLRNP